MSIQTIKMSSRGQIVIPQNIREHLGADEGTLFAVVGSGDGTLVLKRVAMPSKEDLLKELQRISKEGRKHVEHMGLKERDIAEIALRRRHSG